MTGHMGAAPVRQPGLRGIGFHLYRVVWFALLGLAVFVTVASAALTNRYYEDVFRPFVSLGLRWNYSKTVSMTVPSRLDGDLATIRPGDVIVSVDGRPVPHDFMQIAETTGALKAAPGPVVQVRTRSRDGTLRDHALRRIISPDQASASLMRGRDLLVTQQIISFVSGALAITAAVLLFARRSRDPAAAAMSMALLLGSMATGAVFPVTAFAPALAPILLALATPTILGLGLAILIFPNGRFQGRFSVALAALATAVTLVLEPLRFEVWPTLAGLAYPLGNLLIGFLVISVGLLFIRYRKLAPGIQRQQIRWALFGFACAALFLPLSTVVNQFAYASTAFRWSTIYIAAGTAIKALAVICFVAGLLISLLRYRLYDAEAVISRSATFAIVTLGLGAGWAGAEKAIEVFLEHTMGHEAGVTSAGIAAALAALLISPVHQRVHHQVEHVFQKKLADLRRTLPEVVGDLRETASPDELIAYVLTQVCGALRAGHGAIALRTPGKGLMLGGVHGLPESEAKAWLADFHPDATEPFRDTDDPVFPLRHPLVVNAGGAATTVGWFLLGPRPDGSFYGKDELQALREAAGPIARALQIVQLRQAREAALLGEIGRLREDMAALMRKPARRKPA